MCSGLGYSLWKACPAPSPPPPASVPGMDCLWPARRSTRSEDVTCPQVQKSGSFNFSTQALVTLAPVQLQLLPISILSLPSSRREAPSHFPDGPFLPWRVFLLQAPSAHTGAVLKPLMLHQQYKELGRLQELEFLWGRTWFQRRPWTTHLGGGKAPKTHTQPHIWLGAF